MIDYLLIAVHAFAVDDILQPMYVNLLINFIDVSIEVEMIPCLKHMNKV